MTSGREMLAYDDEGRLMRVQANESMVPTFRLRWLVDYDGERKLQTEYHYGFAAMGRLWLDVPEVRRP